MATNKLEQYIGIDNIVPKLDIDRVNKIGADVIRGFDQDCASRADWEKTAKLAMELATQVSQPKSWPWRGAANVKFPLITNGAIQFNARALPAIISGDGIVKGQVFGPDEDGAKKERAERIGQHMSYQLTEEIEEWVAELDRLLLQIAIVGCAFRKTYFDPAMGRNCSDMIKAEDLIYDHKTPWLKLRRITHRISMYYNDIIERTRSGIYHDVGLKEESNSEDEAKELLEQHCWIDLDDDGYREPYIVTVIRDSGEVLRIVASYDAESIYLNSDGEVAKVTPIQYFTKFGFLQNPDGGSYDIGLGALLNPISETVNGLINQLLDSGTLSNTVGGFISSGLRTKGGATSFAPGEFKTVDTQGGRIADSIYHMQFQGPSPVLFNLLGIMIEAGKDISSVKDVLSGSGQGANASPTTTLALIEQGQKVFSAIYKRVHASLKSEFKKLYQLNKQYMLPEDYYRFNDSQQKILLDDYQGDDTDVAPVSDPDLITDAQELARADALMRFIGDPLINQRELRERYLKAIKVRDIESLLMPEQPQLPPELEQQIQEGMALIQQLQAENEQLKQQHIQAGHEQAIMIAQLNAQTAMDKARLDSETKLQTTQMSIEADIVIARMKADDEVERDLIGRELDAQQAEKTALMEQETSNEGIEQ